MEPRRARVVIIGGGFAGLSAAQQLRPEHDVVLIDRAASFEFLPNIHEIVSRRKRPDTVRLPRAKILRDLGHTFIEGAVTRLDLASRRVTTEREVLSYEVLIVAAGGAPILSEVPGAEQHAIPFRSASAAETIADRLRDLASSALGGTVTIVGGGFTGVEVLGEILRKHRKKRRLSLRLIEAGPRLLAGWPAKLHRRIRKLAEKKRVELLFGSRVTAVEGDRIALSDGRELASSLTIWTTGTRPPRFVRESGLLEGESKLIPVREDLSVAGHPQLLVAGDLADHPARPPKQAAQAIDMGERAGKNAARILAGRPTKPFEPDRAPLLLTFGDLSTFLVDEDGDVIEDHAYAPVRELVFQQVMADLDPVSARGARRRLRRRLDRIEVADLGGLLGRVMFPGWRMRSPFRLW